MGFQTRKSIEVFRREGGPKRDGGKFGDTVLLVEVVEAERTERFDAKMFVSLGWMEEGSDGKMYPALGQGGKPKKLIDATHLPAILAALAAAQDFIDNGDVYEDEPESEDDGNDGIPF